MRKKLEDAYNLSRATFDDRNPTADVKAMPYFSSSVEFLHHHSQSEVSSSKALISKNCRSDWAVYSPKFRSVQYDI